MSAPSTALTKGLEQELPPTDHAPLAPAAAAGSQEGPAAVVAISKNGFIHPALCGYGLANEKVVIVINLKPKSRATNRKIFQKFVRLHEKTPLGGKLPAHDGWKSYYYSTGALHFKSAVFLVILVDEGKGEGQPTQMGLSLNIDEFLNKHDTAQTLPGKDLKDTGRYLRNMTCSQFKQAPERGQNKVYHADSMIKGKGISGSDSSCAFSTRAAGNADVNKDAQAAPCINDAKLTQVCGREVSMHEDLHAMTAKKLVDSACQKIGIRPHDFYTTHGGKCLEDDKHLSYYPIYKDSTVHIRPRLRAGRKAEFELQSFDEKISSHKADLFHVVNLSHLSMNSQTKVNSVTFLSPFSQYIIHEILVFICGKHREGLSFNGAFERIDIIFCVGNERVVFASNIREVNFTQSTCSNDYATLMQIFERTFYDTTHNRFPRYFKHFLTYLFECPAGPKSRNEPLISFLTNHPTLQSYMDRIKQCILLESMTNILLPKNKI